MCGRFFFAETIDLTAYHKILERKYDPIPLNLWKRSGEVFPGDVILTVNQRFEPCLMKWSYDLFGRNLINTRLESLEQKDFYRNDYRQHRCLIIASGFYEWDSHKQRWYLHTDHDPLFLAGIYQNKNGSECCSIITKPATKSAAIHDRCPVIFNKEQAKAYLKEGSFELLHGADPELLIEKA